MKKTRLNRLEFWKNRSVRFRFYKPETEKTEPNRTEPKPKKTEPNRKKTEPNWKTDPNRKNQAKPVWTGFYSKNQTKTGRFRNLKKKINLIIFLIKIKSN